jgi:hypothetical protein
VNLVTNGTTETKTGNESANEMAKGTGSEMASEAVSGSFGARLRVAMGERGPLCAGIDPHPGLLAQWGLDDTVNGLETFAMTCVEAFAGTVAIVKPQSAFFERFGSAGVAVLERTLAGLREAPCRCSTQSGVTSARP